MSCDGKGKTEADARRVALYGGGDIRASPKELDDCTKLAIYLLLRHPQNRAVEIDILHPGQFGVKASTDLQHGCNSSTDCDTTRSRICNPGQYFQECALPCPVPPDNSNHFAGLNRKRNITQ